MPLKSKSTKGMSTPLQKKSKSSERVYYLYIVDQKRVIIKSTRDWKQARIRQAKLENSPVAVIDMYTISSDKWDQTDCWNVLRHVRPDSGPARVARKILKDTTDNFNGWKYWIVDDREEECYAIENLNSLYQGIMPDPEWQRKYVVRARSAREAIAKSINKRKVPDNDKETIRSKR